MRACSSSIIYISFSCRTGDTLQIKEGEEEKQMGEQGEVAGVLEDEAGRVLTWEVEGLQGGRKGKV